MGDLDALKIGSLIRKLPPSIQDLKHKNEAGVIGFIGGCVESTGSLFYAAITALRIGVDVCHVFCTKDAAPIVKSYSPEINVHPILDDNYVIEKIQKFFNEIDVFVLGTGLKIDDLMYFKKIDQIVDICKQKQKPLIIDDGYLNHLADNLNILNGYATQIVLCPNHKEFQVLVDSQVDSNQLEIGMDRKLLAKAILLQNSNITICIKGENDEIFNTIFHIKVTEGGSGKRSIGQGSVLSGAAAVFLLWAKQRILSVESMYDYQALVAACAASVFTRTCNEKAFEKAGRSMNTVDMIKEIHNAFEELFEAHS